MCNVPIQIDLTMVKKSLKSPEFAQETNFQTT